MSNIFSKYQKELAGVRVINSSMAYIYNPKTKKKDLLNPNFNFVGKIDMTMPNFILKANKPNHKTGYIEEVSCLPKRLKIDIVNHFYDSHGLRNRRTKAYLIRTDRHRASGSGVVR